jgi:hypothetical protein
MTAAPSRRADHDTLARTFDFDHLDLWSTRDTTGKAFVVLREGAARLDGMTNLLYALAGYHGTHKHNAAKFMFLAASTRDIARVLGAMAELIHADGEAEFDSAVKAERAAKRKPRRDVAGAAPC